MLQGIWATAPYLHNGSVPTLAELLKPPADRVRQFKVGNAYDTVNIGLAVEQTQFDAIVTTTIAATSIPATAIAAIRSGRNCRNPRRRRCWNI